MAAAGTGFLVGMLFVLLAIQFYADVRQSLSRLSGQQGMNDVLILYKKVEATSALSLFDNRFTASFSETDLRELSGHPLVRDMAPFRSNTFRFYTDLGEKLNIYADLFFESVPDRFLDTIPEGWDWREGDSIVPVMMSRDFLDIYNFNVTMLYDLPQVSPEVLREIPVDLVVMGPNKRLDLQARIVGFSTRFPSILVPESFLEWANRAFGSGDNPEVTKVVVAVADASDPGWLAFMKEHQLESGSEPPKYGIMKRAAWLVLFAGSVVGVAFVSLSVLIFVLALQLMLTRSAGEISLLLTLGYSPAYLTKHMFSWFLKFLALITLLAVTLFLVLHSALGSWASAKGLALMVWPSWLAFAAAGCLFTLTLALNYGSIRKMIFQRFYHPN